MNFTTSTLKSFLLVTIYALVSLCPAQTAVHATGSGTATDPFHIDSLPNLQWLTTDSTVWSKVFVQGKDIDASITSTWDGGAGFTPIGHYGYKKATFRGQYHGSGHTITGLTINRPSTDLIGLFSYMEYGSVDSLSLQSASIIGRNAVGAIVGFTNIAHFKYINASGTVQGLDTIGGLIGFSGGDTILNSIVSVQVTGKYEVGGFIGIARGINFSIKSNWATGNTIGFFDVGGFVGNNNAHLTHDSASGNVTGAVDVGGFAGTNASFLSNVRASGTVISDTGYNAGGLVGYNTEYGYIIESYATGAITGIIRVGGLVGLNNGDVEDCYSTGAVTGINAVGGIEGGGAGNTCGSIWYSYATGKITTPSKSMQVGGVDGDPWNCSGQKDYNSFWDTTTSGITVDAFSKGLSDSAMKVQASYGGWGFTCIWKMDGSYPILRQFTNDTCIPAPVALHNQVQTGGSWVSVTRSTLLYNNLHGHAVLVNLNGSVVASFEAKGAGLQPLFVQPGFYVLRSQGFAQQIQLGR